MFIHQFVYINNRLVKNPVEHIHKHYLCTIDLTTMDASLIYFTEI